MKKKTIKQFTQENQSKLRILMSDLHRIIRLDGFNPNTNLGKCFLNLMVEIDRHVPPYMSLGGAYELRRAKEELARLMSEGAVKL